MNLRLRILVSFYFIIFYQKNQSVLTSPPCSPYSNLIVYAFTLLLFESFKMTSINTFKSPFQATQKGTEKFWKALDNLEAGEAGYRLVHADVNDNLGHPHSALHHVLIHSKLHNCAILFLVVGARFDGVDEQGRSPLMLATQAQLYDPIKFMIENGADITVVDHNGSNVMDYIQKDDDQARTLLEKPWLEASLKGSAAHSKPARL